MNLQNGTLKVIDRKKNIFKLSQGEYIAPEKIESIYIKSQYVSQAFVHGESLKSCTVGVIVPDVENVKRYAEERGIPGAHSVLCNMPEIKQLIMNDITDLGKKGGLKSFEQVWLSVILILKLLNLLVIGVFYLGQRYLLAPRRLLGAEWLVDTDTQVETL